MWKTVIGRKERRIIDPDMDGGIIQSERGECKVKKSMTTSIVEKLYKKR